MLLPESNRTNRPAHITLDPRGEFEPRECVELK
jgi:hypothetical protein